jgi:hypothetical protein
MNPARRWRVRRRRNVAATSRQRRPATVPAMETIQQPTQPRPSRSQSRIRRFARYDLPVLRPSMSRATLTRILRARV